MGSSVFEVSVIPKSSRSKINIDEQNNIKVYLNSPPVDGKANAELVRLLSKELDIPKSRIQIIRGEKGRKKTISLDGISKEDVIKILKAE